MYPDPLLDSDRVLRRKLDLIDRRLRQLEAGERIGQNDAWITPTLGSSWVDFGSGWATCQYMKDALGFVHIKGLIKNGVTGTLFTLPSGYRPLENHLFPTSTWDGSTEANGHYSVQSSGAVSIDTAPGNTWFAIECSFLAEQ